MTKQERKDRGRAEVWTPHKLVKDMIKKLPSSLWRRGKTFCDPACGHGNMLIHVLWRKLERHHEPLEALQSIYGADIMPDNVQECRTRLLKVISFMGKINKTHVIAVTDNIVSTAHLTKGSLEYDFSFPKTGKYESVLVWRKRVKSNELLEEVF